MRGRCGEFQLQLVLDAELGAVMAFVGDNIGQRPLDAFLEGVFADGAVFFEADAAGEVLAGIGVYKELH
jgi:hypothetical protein